MIVYYSQIIIHCQSRSFTFSQDLYDPIVCFSHFSEFRKFFENVSLFGQPLYVDESACWRNGMLATFPSWFKLFNLDNYLRVTPEVYDHALKQTILKLKVYDRFAESIRWFNWKYTIKKTHSLVLIRRELYDLRKKVYDHVFMNMRVKSK